MEYDTDDLHSAALCAWKEARGDGNDAMRAVLHVLVNRVGAAGFAKNLHDVIYGKNQFSSMSIPADPEFNLDPADPKLGQGDRDGFVYCMGIAPSVLAGSDEDLTCSAVFYANEATEKSGWYKRVIIDSGNHPVTAVIGKQTFRK